MSEPVGPNLLPRRLLEPAEVKRILAGDPKDYPWREAATAGIRRHIEAGKWIELREDGAWIEREPLP